MKKNMKGFTLIELLAVIVILAVIALIATPIIMNVINDAKEGADRDGAYGVLKSIETAVAQQMVTDTNFTVAGKTCTLTATACTVTGGPTISIDVKGTKPSSGTVVFDANGKITTGTSVKMPSTTAAFTYNGDKFTN